MKPILKVILSVDWEGLTLEAENLQAIVDFKMVHGCPMVHYLNPAYASHPDNLDKKMQGAIDCCLRNDDEIGLHLHAPRHLLRSAGVSSISGPAFTRSGESYRGDFQGQEKMLHGLSNQEFAQLLDHSRAVFQRWGLSDVRSFRAGGWMLSAEQLQVLDRRGFGFDSSSVSSETLNGSCWDGENLQRYVELLWQDHSLSDQPYCVPGTNSLIEIPNNLGAIDYWRPEQVQRYLEVSLQSAEDDGEHLIVVTAHQETFAQYRPILEAFMKDLSVQRACDIHFTSNSNWKSLPVHHWLPRGVNHQSFARVPLN